MFIKEVNRKVTNKDWVQLKIYELLNFIKFWVFFNLYVLKNTYKVNRRGLPLYHYSIIGIVYQFGPLTVVMLW